MTWLHHFVLPTHNKRGLQFEVDVAWGGASWFLSCSIVALGSYKRAMNGGMDAEGNGYRRYVTNAAITTVLGVNPLQ